MLVLERKTEQKVYIYTSDGVVTITLISAGKDRARIGFEAPLSVPIERDDMTGPPRRQGGAA